jgi:hypothetical protein
MGPPNFLKTPHAKSRGKDTRSRLRASTTHDKTIAEIERDRAALDRRTELEDAPWIKKGEALRLALQKAKRS